MSASSRFAMGWKLPIHAEMSHVEMSHVEVGTCWALGKMFPKRGRTFPSFSKKESSEGDPIQFLDVKGLVVVRISNVAIWFHMYTWWSVIKRCQDSTTLDIISDDICRHILGNDIWTQRDPKDVHITALLFQRVPRFFFFLAFCYNLGIYSPYISPFILLKGKHIWPYRIYHLLQTSIDKLRLMIDMWHVKVLGWLRDIATIQAHSTLNT